MPAFEPARELCRRFYLDVVAPLVDTEHAAGLLGPGSDVLGYDTMRSTDHDWGPRCHIFVARDEVHRLTARITAGLPPSYSGWPLAIGRDGMPNEPKVVVTTVADWVRGELGWSVLDEPLTAVDWLALPQMRLLGVTSGAVFADGGGELSRVRHLLRWYPEDVWWWLIACQWQRIAQEEPFVQRTAEVGDPVGSAVLTARLVRDCMRLALLLERAYAPYSKWLGTAFSRLPDHDGLGALLANALAAASSQERERALGAAYSMLAKRFNALDPRWALATETGPFFTRPAIVLMAGRFADAARDRVRDRHLLRLPLVGSVDQVLDSTDALSAPEVVASLRGWYRELAG